MWTDAQIAEALQTARQIEQAAKDAMQTSDLPERDRATVVYRQMRACRLSLEEWIGMRSMRAHLVRKNAS